MLLSRSEDDQQADQQGDYLRKLTTYFQVVEKPLGLPVMVDTLNDLIDKLQKAFSSIKVDMDLVNHLMLSYKPKAVEWQTYAKWNRKRYTRNLVNAGNGKFNLIVICWPPDTGSSIHDHSNSHCFMKILQGKLMEKRYAMPKHTYFEKKQGDFNEANLDTKLEEIFSMQLWEGNITYINDNIGLHRIENPSHIDGAASLHLYCPPFDTCSLFPAGSSRSVKCPVTFYSRFGRKCK